LTILALVSIISFVADLRGIAMKVDVSDIMRINGASMEVDFEEAPSEREPAEGYRLEGTLSFKGTLTNTNGILQLDGRLKGAYSSECYRCLREVKKDINLKINENFINSGEAERTEDMYPFEGKVLELGKALKDNIILNLPMKQLCSKDCKGLCSRCGANLNETQCGCCENEIDPRMEGLGKYFE
jgi:uncharacterized protein